MKFFYFLLISLFLKNSMANVLLVASEKTSPDDYVKICEKNQYDCFPMAYMKFISLEKPIYTELMESFDLDDPDYLKSFFEKINLTLKTEVLTLDNLKMLGSALQKINASTKVYKKSLNLLSKIQKIQSTMSDFNDESTKNKIIFILGKTVAYNEKNVSKLKPFLNDVKYSIVSFNSYQNSVDAHPVHFLVGQCDRPSYAEQIKSTTTDLQIIPFFPEGCSLAQKYDWGSDLMMNHFKEHKNKYYWGLGILAGALMMKNYDVEIVR